MHCCSVVMNALLVIIYTSLSVILYSINPIHVRVNLSKTILIFR